MSRKNRSNNHSAARPKLAQRLKSRKLLVGIVCLAAGVAIDLTTARGLSDNLLTLLIAILGIYVTGNVGAKAATSLKKATAQPKVDVDSAVKSSVETLKKDVQNLNGGFNQLDQTINGTINAVSEVQRQMNELSGIVEQSFKKQQ